MMFISARAAEIPLPQPVAARIDAVFARLHEAQRPGDYATADYLADLDAIGKMIVSDAAAAQALSSAGPELSAKEEFARVALELQAPGGAERLERVKIFYGCYAYQVPLEAVRKVVAERNITRYMIPPDLARVNKSHGGPEVYPFMKELAGPEDLAAWEAWLLAPPSGERRLMLPTVGRALSLIHNPRCIPLAVQQAKIEVTRQAEASARRGGLRGLLGLIGHMPGEPALNSLLECNRLAVAQNIGGEGYGSTTQFVVTLLSSRDDLVERDADKAYMQRLKDSGIEPISADPAQPANDLWKTYKPLVEAKLKAADRDTPPEDLDVLKQALAAMPQK